MTDSLKILITAAGAPQSPTLIRHLKANGERPVSIVAVDMDAEASGRFLADSFHVIPPAGGDGYHEAILDVVACERPDVFLNVSGNDVRYIAEMCDEIEALGTRVCASSAETIAAVDNKHTLYTTVASMVAPDRVPEFASPRSLDEFVSLAHEMGYPDRDLCFKPHVSKGTRGFRVLTERFDRRDLLLNHKPISRYIGLDEFVSIFADAPAFPDLLLMEVAVGEEYDAMTLAYEGEALLTTVKSRESHRWGVIDKGELLDRPVIVSHVADIISAVPLSYNLSIQFIGEKLIEINPRTSTFIYDDDFNEPWLAVKLALGLITPEGVRAYQERVPIGRRMVRHMDQIFFDPDGAWSR